MDKVDFSDAIAWVRVLVIVLEQREPGGEWLNNALLQSYLANHYSLSRGEFREMTLHLEQQLENWRRKKRTHE